MSSFYQDDGAPCTHRKICLATTSYGNPDAAYTFSIQASREALHKAGFETAYYLLQGNCHVDDARNRIVYHFLKSDCTDLVFLDADVSWEPEDLIRLCQHDADVVGGVYPHRRESNNMPVRLIEGALVVDGLVEVEGLPTGFMRIRRHVLERMAAVSASYPQDSETVHILFERTLINGTRWGGDLNFCNRWRALGGKVFADYEMVLGHTGRITYRGSLGSMLRKRNRETLAHVVARIRLGAPSMRDLIEAIEYVGNSFGAQADGLAACIQLARETDGPIIEAGSGLSTVLMAAATRHTVYCLEHDPLHAAKLRQMAYEAGTPNIGLCKVPLKDGWYDLSAFNGLPARFALGFNDGPPPSLADRMKFFQHLDCDVVVCDDAATYRAELEAMRAEFITPRVAVVRRASMEAAA